MNVNAGLASLANNGGPTFTHQLLAASPAIDAGSNALAVDANGQPLTTDQRASGFSRILSVSVDIGSLESREAVLIVDTLSDNGGLTACTNAANDCSLRGAITRSANIIDTVISFDPIVFAFPQTITLTNGELVINIQGTLTINGSNGVRISGNNTSRVFNIFFVSTATLQGLTITAGTGVLGGGIYTEGNLTINNCTISGNNSSQAGGGIYQDNNTLTVTNSTISGNTSDLGGGVYSNNSPSFQNVTVTNNSAFSSGGGIQDASAFAPIGRSIIAGNSAPDSPDFSGIIDSRGYNLIGNSQGTSIGGNTTGNILNQNAQLAPLGYYGGTTMTHALLSSSPAINAGNTAASPTLDQRGAARIGTADIGAFEVNNTVNGGNYVATLPNGNQNVGYNFTIAPNNGSFTYSVTSGSLPNGLSLTNSFAPTAVVTISGTPTESGTFNFSINATNGVNSIVTNYSLLVLAPTAATSTVSGRVFMPTGRGLANASVIMTNQNGETFRTRTNPFGYYRFTEVQAGETYIFSVASKRYQFASQVVNVAENIDGLNFFGQ